MDSFISKELNGRFEPIIMCRSNEKPFEATQPKQKEHGCMMTYFFTSCCGGKNSCI